MLALSASCLGLKTRSCRRRSSLTKTTQSTNPSPSRDWSLAAVYNCIRFRIRRPESSSWRTRAGWRRRDTLIPGPSDSRRKWRNSRRFKKKSSRSDRNWWVSWSIGRAGGEQMRKRRRYLRSTRYQIILRRDNPFANFAWWTYQNK